MKRLFLPLVALAMFFAACNGSTEKDNHEDDHSNTDSTSTGMVDEEFQKDLQERLILAEPGSVIEIPAGTYYFDRSLSLDGIDGITIKGAGMGETILDFAAQTEGAEGIKITNANDVTISNLTVQNSAGDGIKVQECVGLIMDGLQVTWTNGPASENGGYGLYPVQCENVQVMNCEVSCASDAGIYLGQSHNAEIKDNYVHKNVAGIEVENSTLVDVYNNECDNNTGGILVFDLPELPKKNGRDVRVYDNVITDNNHENFAPEGGMVAITPAGTGVLILATTDVEVRGNAITNNYTVPIGIISYSLLEMEYDDPDYNPLVDNIYIVNNLIVNEKYEPDMTKEMGQLMAMMLQGAQADIVTDGIMAPDAKICVHGNGDAVVVNLDAANEFAGMEVGTTAFDCELPDKTEGPTL